MECYLHFNLDMGRSPGFGSNTTDFIRPIQTRSRYGSGPEVLNLASYIHSPDHSTKVPDHPIDGLSVLVSTRFQVLFTPLRGAFHLSFTVLYTIGHWVVFRLGGWSPHIPTGFHVSGGTLDTASSVLFRVRDSHTVSSAFPCRSTRFPRYTLLSEPQKYYYSWFGLFRVRLATTSGISVDFSSSPYLDVSVQAVPLVHLCIQCTMTGHDSSRIAPFGNLRINAHLRLPVAYRS